MTTMDIFTSWAYVSGIVGVVLILFAWTESPIANSEEASTVVALLAALLWPLLAVGLLGVGLYYGGRVLVVGVRDLIDLIPRRASAALPTARVLPPDISRKDPP